MTNIEMDPIFHLMLVVDFQAWQGSRITEKNVIKALAGVMKKVHYTLGCHGIDTDRQFILLHLDNTSEDIDACLDKVGGVLLFGKERPIENTEQAIKHTLASQVLAGTSIVLGFAHDVATLPIVTDRRFVKVLSLKWISTGGKEVVQTTLQHLSWSSNPEEIGEDALISDPSAEDQSSQRGQTPAQAESPNVLLGWDGHELVKTMLDEKSNLEENLKEQVARANAAETLSLQTKEKCEAFELELEKRTLLDFVPLVRTIRGYESDHGGASKRFKPFRSCIAEIINSQYAWPIGYAQYPKFRALVEGAKQAGVVEVFDNQKGGWLRSTGKLESLYGISPDRHFTTGWPSVC